MEHVGAGIFLRLRYKASMVMYIIRETSLLP